jgi:hypothetical protein
MATSPLTPHLGTPLELKDRIAAERAGKPFLVYRDEQGRQQMLVLGDGAVAFTIGRSEECDVRLSWDGEVSVLHAELRRVSGHWLVVDDGLSRNGSYVNGLAGRPASPSLAGPRTRPRSTLPDKAAGDWAAAPLGGGRFARMGR